MVNAVKTLIPTDSWVSMAWNEYLSQIEAPQLKEAKTYYYQGHGRFEMLPVGFGHGESHAVATYAINLFCAMKAVPLRMVDTTTLRKDGIDDCQPDLSVWVGSKARTIPTETSIVDLSRYPTPDLVIEIANTSLLDDMGTKRALYESLETSEYWIVDVKKSRVFAFEILSRGSQRLETSKVLPGFDLSTLEESLRRSRDTDQAAMGSWLLQQFQQ